MREEKFDNYLFPEFMVRQRPEIKSNVIQQKIQGMNDINEVLRIINEC